MKHREISLLKCASCLSMLSLWTKELSENTQTDMKTSTSKSQYLTYYYYYYSYSYPTSSHPSAVFVPPLDILHHCYPLSAHDQLVSPTARSSTTKNSHPCWISFTQTLSFNLCKTQCTCVSAFQTISSADPSFKLPASFRTSFWLELASHRHSATMFARHTHMCICISDNCKPGSFFQLMLVASFRTSFWIEQLPLQDTQTQTQLLTNQTQNWLILIHCWNRPRIFIFGSWSSSYDVDNFKLEESDTASPCRRAFVLVLLIILCWIPVMVVVTKQIERWFCNQRLWIGSGYLLYQSGICWHLIEISHNIMGNFWNLISADQKWFPLLQSSAFLMIESATCQALNMVGDTMFSFSLKWL